MTKKNPYQTGYTPEEIFSEEFAVEPPASPVIPSDASVPLPNISDADLAAAAKARLGISATDKEDAEAEKLRALADLDNARKRLVREKEEFIRYSSEKVISDILPALDTLDLALSHAPKEDACKNFVIGVDMTRKMLLEALSRHGLTEIGALGEAFDPAMHEAVSTARHPDYPPDTVCDLLNKGYRLHDRLIRPAKVSVCK